MTAPSFSRWVAFFGLGLAMVVGGPGLNAQTTEGSLSITLLDGLNGRPVGDAMIVVLGADGTSPVPRTTSNADGQVMLTLPAGTYSVEISRMTYVETRLDDVTVVAGQTRNLELSLAVASHQLDEVQVTGGRQEGSTLRATQAITVVGRELVAERAAMSTVDHVRAVKGVDVASSGLYQSNIVTRGFNNVFSGSLLLLVDDRYAHVPSLRLNAAHWIPTTDLDIERIEISLGPGAALYGPNSANGVMHIVTASPIDRPGSSFSVTTGERNLFLGAFRTAVAPTQKFGIKVSGQYLQGDDWPYIDPDEVLAKEADPTNPLLAARDNNLEKWGGEIRMDLRPDEDTEFILTAGRNSNVNGVELSQIGAGQTLDWRYDFAQLRAKKGEFSGQIFLNQTNSGDSFLLRTGGGIVDHSRMFGAQIRHGVTVQERIDLSYGIDLQRTEPRSLGSIYGRNEDDDIIDEVGGYLYSTTHLTDQLDFVGALRLDRHSRLDGLKATPRAAFVYSPNEYQSFRASFNRAFNTPTTNNLFLDVIAANLAPGLDLRTFGVPSTGLTFGSCAGGLNDLCMQAVGAPGVSLPADATLAWDQLIGLIAPDLQAFLPNPGTSVSTVLRRFSVQGAGTGDPFPLDLAGPTDIARMRSDTRDTYEIGFNGLVGDKLILGADLYHSRTRDFVGPLTVETPSVFLDPASTAAYVTGQLAALVAQGDVTEEEVAAIIAGLAQIPVGTVAPEQSPSSDLLLTYRNVDENMNVWGADLGATFLASSNLSFTGSLSLVSEECFDFDDDGACTSSSDIALNAPQAKGSIGGRYEDRESGFFAGARVRHTGGFPMNSGVYVGEVDSYTLVDLNAGTQLSWLPGSAVSVDVSNIFDNRHREFVGAPNIGRLLVIRLQYRTN